MKLLLVTIMLTVIIADVCDPGSGVNISPNTYSTNVDYELNTGGGSTSPATAPISSFITMTGSGCTLSSCTIVTASVGSCNTATVSHFTGANAGTTVTLTI